MKRAILTMMAVLLCIAITVPVGSASSDPWWRTEEYYGAGIDCSGVPFWAVNTVLDTKTYNAKSPIPEDAHGQYDKKEFLQKDLKITETKGIFEYDKLEPGDLIFIDTEAKGKLGSKDKDGKDGKVDHVLVYLGDGGVCHAVGGKTNKVVIEKLDSALKRSVDGKTYFDCFAGCGRLTVLTSDQRSEMVKLVRSLEGAPYQYGAKGYDVKEGKFVTDKEIIEGGYVWNWDYNDELKIIKEELNKEGVISEKLRAIFKTKGYSFSENAVVTKVKGDKWMIKDRGKCYIVEIEYGKLNIYEKEKENENEDLGGIDFSSIQLNYISVSSDKDGGTFSYVLKAQKAEEGDNIIDIEDATELSLNTFFIGLTLPESKFWVNLDPWEPDRIMDEDLRNTDVGRIMLEADLQMKKDFCKYENPCESEIGEEYNELLDKKLEELAKKCMRKYPTEIEDVNNIVFSSIISRWILPDRTDAYRTDDGIYIVDITLNINLYPEYDDSTYEIKNQDLYLFSIDAKIENDLNKNIIAEKLKDMFRTEGFPLSDNAIVTKNEENGWVITDEEKFIVIKEYGVLSIYKKPFISDECNEHLNKAASEYCCYMMELEEEMILPLVVQEVNHDEKYSDLRQVYTSLALAQWYKDKYGTSGLFRDFIDSGDLAGLESKYTWSAEDVWGDYVRSFEEGEYHCCRSRTYEEGGYIITKSMLDSCGGVVFTDIILTTIGDMSSNLKELTSEAVYTTFANEGDDYYFGDELHVICSNSTQNTTAEVTETPTSTINTPIPTSPGFEAIFAIAGLLVVAYLLRRRK